MFRTSALNIEHSAFIHCNTPQHTATATHCQNTASATHCNCNTWRRRTACQHFQNVSPGHRTLCIHSLQHIATATHCNSNARQLQHMKRHTALQHISEVSCKRRTLYIFCHCNKLQLQHTATATHCSCNIQSDVRQHTSKDSSVVS